MINNADSRKEGLFLKRLKIIVTVICGLIASLALTLGVASAQALCVIHFHQPKVPQGMSKFLKR